MIYKSQECRWPFHQMWWLVKHLQQNSLFIPTILIMRKLLPIHNPVTSNALTPIISLLNRLRQNVRLREGGDLESGTDWSCMHQLSPDKQSGMMCALEAKERPATGQQCIPKTKAQGRGVISLLTPFSGGKRIRERRSNGNHALCRSCGNKREDHRWDWCKPSRL